MNQGLLLSSSHRTINQQPSGASSWQPVGSVKAAYIRAPKEPEPRRLLKVDAVANYGIVSDRHACPHSPRQLLIAGDAAYDRFRLPEATLRENLRVDFSTTSVRSGDLLRIGSQVVLWVTFDCEPCSLLERRHPGTVKTIGRHRGVLARVLRSGAFGVGDEVSLVRGVLPVMNNDWRVRVLNVAHAIPAGYYISYRQLAEMAGVAIAYCRAFPRILSGLPIDVSSRVISATKALPGPQWNGAELFDMAHHFDSEQPAFSLQQSSAKHVEFRLPVGSVRSASV